MRLARKLALLTIIAITALALTAPVAFAQETELEASSESLGTHCSSVILNVHAVSGGCPIHVTSDHPVTLRAHVFGIESTESSCSSERDGRLDENGEGYFYNQILADVTPGSCPREACSEGNEVDGVKLPWRIHGHENPSSVHADQGFTEGLTMTFCLATEIDMTPRPACNVEITFRSSEGAAHHYEFGEEGVEMAGIGAAGFRCELVGHWNTEEANTDIEITHTD